MGRRASLERRRVWRGRLAEQRRSGLSIAEYCRRQGLSEPSFYLWRRRLRDERAAAREVRHGDAADGGERSRSSGTALFVPLTLAAAGHGVRLELASGAVLTLPGDASPALVTAAICAALSVSSPEQPAC